MNHHREKYQKKVECLCREAKLAPIGWNRSPCQFKISTENYKEDRSRNILKPLICDCGK